METRVAEEARYVLAVLNHMRDKVVANPEMFVSDALKFIEEATARTEAVVQNLKGSRSAEKRVWTAVTGSSGETDSVK